MQFPENILVRMPNWIGDLVMALPILYDLRKKFPKSQITAMCRKPLSQLLEHDPSIDELLEFHPPRQKWLRKEDLRDLIEKIKMGKYDTAILLTHSFSSAWWCWLASIPRRIGYPGHFRRFLLTDKVEKKKEKEHQVLSYKRILAPLSIPLSDTRPSLFLTKEESLNAEIMLVNQGAIRSKKRIGFHPGAAYGTAKCWPPEHFHALCQKLLAKTDAFLLFFGDRESQALIEKIAPVETDRVINLAGKTNLRQLAALIGQCDLFVTNDSGPMHIADALNTPLIALFGSTDEMQTGPYHQRQNVLRHPVSCSPCFLRKCPIDFRCMKNLSVEEVLARIGRYV